MKIRMIYNFKLLPAGYAAITLYPFIFCREAKGKVSTITLKHEYIHIKQISYLLYFLAGLIALKSWSAAYYDIPFEQQAFDEQLTPLTINEQYEMGLI